MDLRLDGPLREALSSTLIIVQMRDKYLGVMAQFGQISAYLYYIWEVKLLDENRAANPDGLMVLFSGAMPVQLGWKGWILCS